MKKKKVLLLNFPSLHNYGTGMMGLNTIYYLGRLMGEAANLYFPVTEENWKGIQQELGEGECASLRIKDVYPEVGSLRYFFRYPFVKRFLAKFAKGRLQTWDKNWGTTYFSFFEDYECFSPYSFYDAIIVLGGDDISEYYTEEGQKLRCLDNLVQMSKVTQLFLIGQSPGPFTQKHNVRGFKKLSRAHFYVREPECVTYLEQDFGFSKNVQYCGDLAFLSLPLQHKLEVSSLLSSYGLEAGQYVTLVGSGESRFYHTSNEIFVQRLEEIARLMLSYNPQKKLCLLAHTFTSAYGEEKEFIETLYAKLSSEFEGRLVMVNEEIYPTRARLILGNGAYTVSCRMHPLVSTYQMGKPAIGLAYSRKYNGVIGEALGRADLLVSAAEENVWLSGSVVSQVEDRLKYLEQNYERICAEIVPAVQKQQSLAEDCLQQVFSQICC